jgi:outer membrane lipoprotein-sorting protein
MSARHLLTAGLLTALLLWARGAALGAGEASHPDQPSAEAAAKPAQAPRKELPPELRMVLDKLDQANRDLKDVTAKVAYERAIPLLDEKEKATGSLLFKKPDRIVLKLGKPREEEVHTNGQTWWVVSHRDKQVEIYQAAKEGAGNREAAFLDFGYGGGSEKILKDYQAELVSKEVREGEDEGAKETLYRLKFTPLAEPGRPAHYAAIEVVISDKLWLPHELVLHESGGEIIHTYALTDIRTNTEVKDEQFDYEPPRGYTVLRPQE